MATGGISYTVKTVKLEAKIRQRLRETPLAEQQIMHQVAAYIEGQAKNRAPKDIGTLETSIRSMVAESPKGMVAVVYVPVNACVVESEDGRSFNYAIAMHENDYNPGPKSLDKQRKLGVVVGRKYLVRAISENAEEIKKRIAYQLKKWGWQ